MDVAELIDRALLLRSQGKYEEALQTLLDSALAGHDEALDAEIASYYVERGWALSEDPSLDESGESCGWSCSLGSSGILPSRPQVKEQRAGDDLVWRRDDELAAADFAESLKWYELADAKAGLAAVLFRRGDLEKAKAAVEAALELNPEVLPAQIILARLAIAGGAQAEALELLGRILMVRPDYSAAYLAAAEALEGLGRKDEARELLAKGILKSPGNAQLQVALGRACLEAGDDERARRAWRRASELDPGNVEIWRGLALAAARVNDEFEMNTALDKAFALDDPGTHAWRDREKANLPLLGEYVPEKN